ncbi:MAG: hypothetical protein AAFV07_02610 [Bacteroidota bacterium]
MSNFFRPLLFCLILPLMVACTRSGSDKEASSTDPEAVATDANSAGDSRVVELVDMEPAKLPPASKPEKPEKFQPKPGEKEIAMPITLALPPDASVEKSPEKAGVFWARAYDDDFFLEVEETSQKDWADLLHAIRDDEVYTFRQIVSEYESTALLEVSVEDRLQYVVVGLLPGKEEATYLVKSKPDRIFSQWGAQQMFRSLRLTARKMSQERPS